MGQKPLSFALVDVLLSYREHLSTYRDIKRLLQMNAVTMIQQSQKSKFEQDFLNRFGPLVSQSQLADLLGMTARGLSTFLWRKTELAKGICECRVKVGRRVLYRTVEIAGLLACQQ